MQLNYHISVVVATGAAIFSHAKQPNVAQLCSFLLHLSTDPVARLLHVCVESDKWLKAAAGI